MGQQRYDRDENLSVAKPRCACMPWAKTAYGMLRKCTDRRPALREDGLRLALGAEVALEALAEARRVVADATAGAVAAEVVALAEQHVRARRALLEGAVRAARAEVADTADVLVGVPRGGVGLGGLVRELLLLDAAAAVVAVARAQGALAGLAVVAIEALALARLAVAGALVRAF